MKPNENYVVISDNVAQIKRLIRELVLEPRLKAIEWSKLTKQTPNMKIGYPGQHLASLVVGMEGTKTGARGNDIVDGSEVKSCSRVDASDKCKNCGGKILRTETECPVCGSDDIVRDNTSKWLFTIRNEDDLRLLTGDVKRIILVLADYPNFDRGNYEDIQFQVFEIWTNSPRCVEFKNLMTNYYYNIYKTHKKSDSNKTPAPKNFWPYSFQFYKCNPVKVFSCIIKNANTSPTVQNVFYVEPTIDRSTLKSELMPSAILTKNELPSLTEMLEKTPKKVIERYLAKGKSYEELKDLVKKTKFDKAKFTAIIPFFDEELRNYLPLREDKTFTIKTKHVRK